MKKFAKSLKTEKYFQLNESTLEILRTGLCRNIGNSLKQL